MKKSDLARMRLIQATTDLIDMQGYHGTGINQIIKESRSSQGSLYYYFPEGKEELVSVAIDQHGKNIELQIKKTLANTNDPAESVYSIFLFLAKKFDQEDCMKANSIASVALDTSHTNERLRETCKKIYADWKNAYQDFLLENGFPLSRASQIAMLITSSLEGAIIISRTNRSSEPLLQVGQELKMLIANEQIRLNNNK
ncbi:TetR/AcrR family transcriptional regulator [Shimazuella kribbensis]|uniref:TetR/AcrR family transcriptional regulator n=1 Tax=Shimazuella kribbensis TaxID=139808 RepID=UPI000408C396|nr:TetR/AcrR family transcriptional regulator [Shimazuella kribbensis]